MKAAAPASGDGKKQSFGQKLQQWVKCEGVEPEASCSAAQPAKKAKVADAVDPAKATKFYKLKDLCVCVLFALVVLE